MKNKKNNYLKEGKAMSKYLFMTLFTLLFVSAVAQSQVINVKGVVIGIEDGFPIPGASVVLKGTTIGTITDMDGKYHIKAEKGQTLLFSFIGMVNKEVKVSSDKLDVKLEADVVNLEEIVAIGYGSVLKKELTGAVAQVKSEDISKTVTADLGTALQGQIAGVNVTASSGEPGAASNILIRGISSVSGSNTPLYVVDGIPYSSDPRISSNEIETIDVLKDAASCAIYGTRGAAGVILITTKQGKAGTLKISTSGTYGIRRINSSTDLMNANDQAYFDNVTRRLIDNSYDDKMNTNYSRSPRTILNDTDLRDIALKDNMPTQDYSINISGGSKDISYNVVAGYYNQKGVIINSNYNRFNTRASTTYRSGKWDIRANLGIQTDEKEVGPGIITQTIKYLPSQDEIDPDSHEAVTSNGWGSGASQMNWVLESFQSEDASKTDRVNASLNAKFEVLPGLKLSTNLGGNITNYERYRFKPYTPHYKESTGEELSDPSSSYVRNDHTRSQGVSSDIGLWYQKKFGKHKITATAIYSYEESSYGGFYAKRQEVNNNDIRVLNGAGTSFVTAESISNWENVTIGTIGRLQYDYKSKYLFSASIRRDGSSKFAEDNRWGTFPSVSSAWNISDESFWKPVKKVVNNFKVRGSYGSTGNASFGAYTYAATIQPEVNYVFGDDKATGATQKRYANSEVKWETSIQSNIGFDIGMFNNKLTFTGEYYDTKKEDMLFPVQVPGSNGVGSAGDSRVTLNIGNMTNKGYELSLGYKTKSGAVEWGAVATFATNENKITSMSGDSYLYTNDGGLISGDGASKITVLAKGYEAGAFFLLRTDGIIKTEEDLVKYQELVPSAKMGDLIYIDQFTIDSNGDGIADTKDGAITDADRVYSGSGIPDYTIGVNFNANYKGFDLSMQMYASMGHEIMNGNNATAYSFGRHKDLLYSWSEQNPTSDIPAYRGTSKQHPNYYGYNDLWLEDGSYFRIRNIILGYTLPKSLVRKIGLDKFRMFVSAQNPLTITNYTGYDPEVGGNGLSSRGLDKGVYPVTSFYMAGINLNF